MTLTAHQLITSFVERTGLRGASAQQRYLWTDAFAVCTCLGIGERDLALALVDRVHHVLGRHRPDDARRGWISGLAESEGEEHPTLGGLRIGKALPERGVDEPLDERLEWERDGQYFHYLTKWMHALDQTARATHDRRFARWACELADTAHRRFAHATRGVLRMYWKMSIDLMRPVVPSMGHHDPLDGYVTCLQLDATARKLALAGAPDLRGATADYHSMLEPSGLATADPLGLGGLLVDAYRLQQLGADPTLQEALLAAARRGLARYVEQPELRLSPTHRLAFRELGLVIGLAAVERMNAAGFAPFARLGHAVLDQWRQRDARETRTYREHQDINDVMLATALAPDGFLILAS